MQSTEQRPTSAARVDYERVMSYLEKIGAPFFNNEAGRRVNETRTLEITKQISGYLANDSDLNGCRFFLKLEYENPLTKSVKGRAVASMVLNAIQTGAIFGRSGKKKKWIEPTSGNTGRGLAEIADILGVEFTAVFSRLDVSQTITKDLLSYGAKIVTIGCEYSLSDIESLAKNRKKTISYYWSNFGGANADTQKLLSDKVSEVRGDRLNQVLKQVDGKLLLDKILPLAIEASSKPIVSRAEHGEFEDLKGEMRKSIPELDDESRIVGFVCPEGNTSLLVSTLLNQLGFTNVCNIQGGAKSLRTNQGINSASSEYCPVPGTSITKSSIDFVKKLVSDNPDEYFTFMQYENPENVNAHLKTTGPELEEQVNGLDYVVCTFGSGGTAAGIAKYFKEKKVIAVFPRRPVEGIRTLGGVEGLAFYEPKIYAKVMEVGTDRLESVLRYFVKNGLRFGPSTAVAVVAAIEVAQKEKGKIFAIIAADSLDSYKTEYKHLL